MCNIKKLTYIYIYGSEPTTTEFRSNALTD